MNHRPTRSGAPACPCPRFPAHIRIGAACIIAAASLALVSGLASAAPEMPALKCLDTPNAFQTRRYVPTSLPVFAQSRDKLPQPVVTDTPGVERLYWKAWELAFRNLKQPDARSGFVSNFIDPAFNQNTFQWDSCFMVLFANYAEPMFHAVGSFDNFYAKQHPDGFIMREITRATGEDFHFGSPADFANPPLFSWVEWQSYLSTGDRSRFVDVLPVLARHYRWLQRNRRRDDGFYWNTGLGSGLDDLRRGPADACLDMTCQQALNAYCIALIAEAVGDREAASYFRAENRQLAAMVNQKMWDGASGFYYDLDKDRKPAGVKTVLGFWPLVARIATPAQAERLVAHLTDEREFWRLNVVPALAACEQGYTADGQYWNGAVWAPTNYMVIKGLQAYGYEALASRVTARYLGNMVRVLDDTGTIFENYAPDKPVGHGVRDMVGWSGDGPIALLIENILGIRPDAAHSAIIWRPRLRGENGIRNLRVGRTCVSLVASAPARGVRTLRMSADGPVKVTVDTGVGQPESYSLGGGEKTVQVRIRSRDLLRD
jgi:glycogen debranching enzyme